MSMTTVLVGTDPKTGRPDFHLEVGQTRVWETLRDTAEDNNDVFGEMERGGEAVFFSINDTIAAARIWGSKNWKKDYDPEPWGLEEIVEWLRKYPDHKWWVRAW